jgi:hypothetical protein
MVKNEPDIQFPDHYKTGYYFLDSFIYKENIVTLIKWSSLVDNFFFFFGREKIQCPETGLFVQFGILEDPLKTKL